MKFAFLALSFLLVYARAADDPAALLRLKSQVEDPFRTLESWNESVEFCRWNGVNCSSGRVSGLTVRSLSLSQGLLVDTVRTLSSLKELRISESNVTESSTNSSLKNCVIEILDLSGNQLTQASLPYQLLERCRNITFLDLSRNSLVEISRIVPLHSGSCKLTHLNVSSNALSGTFPSVILSTCSGLKEIFLAHNNLSRIVFPDCTNLVSIDLSFNRISGPIFSNQSLCPVLEDLMISNNAFFGSFFSLFTTAQSNLSSFFPIGNRIDASYNNFTGGIPTMTNLRYLDLSSNNLSEMDNGTRICSSNSRLESLLLQNNRLASGSIFDSLGECINLKMLDISFNDLSGELPSSLCERSSGLQNLIVWANRFTGGITSNLSKCTNMTNMLLSFNSFEGEIPSQIAALSNLEWLDLRNNRLTGSIPSTFGELKKIYALQLANNFLDGEIPVQLGECRNLQFIDLGGNLLSGNIPARIGRVTTESVTLQPRVESRLGQLKYVTPTLALPQCSNASGVFGIQGMTLEDFERLLRRRTGCECRMGYFPLLTLVLDSPIYLDVSNNRLTGGIPPEVGDMQNLLVLDLSNNLLTGSIPANIGRIPTLDTVDFSRNVFSGAIPVNFAHLGTLTRLNISYNNLSGIVPQGPQTGTFIWDGNPGLCNALTSGCYSRNIPPEDDLHNDDNITGDVVGISIAFFIISFIPSTFLSFKLGNLLLLK